MRYVGMMNAMMRETLLSGTARKADIPGWPAAGKTGTSQDFRDAWFIGYTSYLVAGVWLGNDDSSPTKKITGGGLPVEVWSRFMKVAHQGVPVADLPGLTVGQLIAALPPANIPPAPMATDSRAHSRSRAAASTAGSSINCLGGSSTYPYSSPLPARRERSDRVSDPGEGKLPKR